MQFFVKTLEEASIEIRWKNRESMIELDSKHASKLLEISSSILHKTPLQLSHKNKGSTKIINLMIESLDNNSETKKIIFMKLGQQRGWKEMKRDGNNKVKNNSLRIKGYNTRIKNTNGIGYNPISHAYEASQRGKKLESYDETKQVNRFARSKNIIEKTVSPYNIITGEPNTKIKQIIPQKYRDRVEQKYMYKMEREKVKYEPIRDKYDYIDDQ